MQPDNPYESPQASPPLENGNASGMARLLLPISFIVLGTLGILLSLPAFLFAMLGFAGILADVSAAENREFANEFLGCGLPFLLGGLVFVAVGVVNLLARRHSESK